MGGEFFNSEEIFESWNNEEKWFEVDDIKDFCPQFPHSVIQPGKNLTLKSSSDYLKLKTDEHSIESKKGKKVSSKAAKNAPIEFTDASISEDGHLIPRVYIGHQSSCGELLTFRRQWSLQQIAVKAQVEAENEAKSLEKNEEKDLHMRSPVINIIEPEGAEYDPLMCASFRLVGQYAKSFSSSLGKTADAFPYLWQAIYPQLPNGTPCYNPAGKYAVKLFVGMCLCHSVIVASCAS
jgi:hypothetical protein